MVRKVDSWPLAADSSGWEKGTRGIRAIVRPLESMPKELSVGIFELSGRTNVRRSQWLTRESRRGAVVICARGFPSNHQGLDNRLILPDESHAANRGRLQCRERLGGMLNYGSRSWIRRRAPELAKAK
jgi:hypothetical protein